LSSSSDLLRFTGLLAFALVLWRVAVHRLELRLID
jgi:hypothetical protein